MTFPEAGLQILERSGRPLHFQEIAAQAIQGGLLSHVGQIPESTMRERLVALAKRSSDRKLMVVGPGQFALTDWGLPEDAGALSDLEAQAEPPAEKPLRGRERHPPVSKPMAARGEGGRESSARSPLGKKKRRLPPLSTVVADLLGEVGAALDWASLLLRGRDKSLMSEDLTRETLSNALIEENRRRAKAGRKELFQLNDETVSLLATPPLELVADPEAREPSKLPEAPEGLFLTATAQALESRRQAARQLKRRVSELAPTALERLVTQLLSQGGYKEARPVRVPGGESERLLVVRRRLGLTELRFLCQILPAGQEASRDTVQALRDWLPHAEAHAAIVVGPGEASLEARAEAQRFGVPMLTLLCGDAFLEELVVRRLGVVTFEATMVDDNFWKNLRRSSEPKAAEAKGEPRPPRPRSGPTLAPRAPRVDEGAAAPAELPATLPIAEAAAPATEQTVEAALPAAAESENSEREGLDALSSPGGSPEVPAARPDAPLASEVAPTASLAMDTPTAVPLDAPTASTTARPEGPPETPIEGLGVLAFVSAEQSAVANTDKVARQAGVAPTNPPGPAEDWPRLPE